MRAKILPFTAAGVYEGNLLAWEAVEPSRSSTVYLYRRLPSGEQKTTSLRAGDVSTALCYKLEKGVKTLTKVHYMVDKKRDTPEYRVLYPELGWDSGWIRVWGHAPISSYVTNRRIRITPESEKPRPVINLGNYAAVDERERWRLDTDVLTLAPGTGAFWSREVIPSMIDPSILFGNLTVPPPEPDPPGDYLYLIVWDRLPRFVNYPDPLPPERARERFSPIDYAIVEWRPLVYLFSERFVDARGKTFTMRQFPRDFSPSRGDRYIIEAKTPPGAMWEVAIGIPNPKTPEDEGSYLWYRRWRGRGPNLRIVWDGKDSRGKPVPRGEDVIVAVYVNGREVQGSIIYVD